MPLRLPQGNIAVSDLICRRLTFVGDGSIISGLDPFTPTRIVLPQVNEPLTPTLGFGDGNTGFFESADNTLRVSVEGVSRFRWTGNEFRGVLSGGPTMINEIPTDTNPVFVFESDANTGMGLSADDQLSLIAGGVQVANLTEAAGVVQLVLPLQNNTAFPSLAIGETGTGFFLSSAGVLRVAIAGNNRWTITANALQSSGESNGPTLRNETSTLTNPTLTPASSDADTGIGWGDEDQLSLIAGGLDCINISEVGAARQIGFYVTAPIALQTGVAVSSAGIHAALVALGLITA